MTVAKTDRVTGESVGRFEFDEEEGIAFWVGTSYEEAAIKNFPNLFAEHADIVTEQLVWVADLPTRKDTP